MTDVLAVQSDTKTSNIDQKQEATLPAVKSRSATPRGLAAQNPQERFENASIQLKAGLDPNSSPEARKAYLTVSTSTFRELSSLENSPDIKQASLYNLGFGERALGNDAAAISAFESFLSASGLEKKDEQLRVLKELGNARFDRGSLGEKVDTEQLRGAEEAYTKALELLSEQPENDQKLEMELRFFRGEARRLHAAHAGAENEQALETAALEDFHVVATHGGAQAQAASERLNVLYSKRGELSKALESVSRENNPSHWAETRYQQALAEYQNGNFAESQIAAKEALSEPALSSVEAQVKLQIVKSDSLLKQTNSEGKLNSEQQSALETEIKELAEIIDSASQNTLTGDQTRDIATALNVKASIALSLIERGESGEKTEELLSAVSEDLSKLQTIDKGIASSAIQEIGEELLRINYSIENAEGVVGAVRVLEQHQGLQTSLQRYQYADSLLRLGEQTSAEGVFKELLSSATEDATSQSIQELDQNHQGNGIALRAGLHLVSLHNASGEFAQAATVLDTLEKNFPNTLDFAGKRYDVLYRVSASETVGVEEKHQVYESYLDKYPAADVSTNLRRVLASEYLSAGAHEKAISHLETLSAQDGAETYDSDLLAEARLGLSKKLIADGKFEAANVELGKLDSSRVSVRMASIESSLGFAANLRTEKNYDQALEVLLEARELLPNSEQGVTAYVEAASTLIERNTDLGDVVRAEVMLLDAAQEAESYAEELKNQIGEDAPSNNDVQERVKTFEELGARALGMRANALDLLGRKTEAQEIRSSLERK